MKAIINLPKSNKCSYSNLNGHTFEVVEVSDFYISLKGANPEYPENQVDFKHNEIIIVDIQKEFDDVRESMREYEMFYIPFHIHRKYKALSKYIEVNKLKVS